MLVDLIGLQPDRLQLAVAEGAAVKQEPQAAGTVGSWPSEVDAHEPAASDLEPALLSRLALTSLPWRLAAVVDLPAGDRPALLVVRSEDQQPAGLVEDQSPR